MLPFILNLDFYFILVFYIIFFLFLTVLLEANFKSHK